MKVGFLATRVSVAAAATIALLIPVTASANTVNFGISVTKKATASIALSTGTFTWANITDDSNTALGADNNPASANVTGTLITTYSSGSGSINVSAPADITGTKGGTLPMSAIKIKCTDAGNTGETLTTTATALTASSSTTCGSYASGYNTPISFELLMYVDDTAFPADTYSSAAGFGLVASAT